MRSNFFVLMVVLSFVFVTNSYAYLIIAVEKGSVLYDKNNKVEKDKPKNKLYYEVDERNKIIKRVKVIQLDTGQTFPDDTIYHIISAPYHRSILSNEKVIHAVGQPGLNAFELLTISSKSIMSAKSTGDYFVIFNCDIIDRSDVPQFGK
ncbi:MAG: hypothetical protein V1753_03495 [Pseudomonadota bacterium]